MKLAGLFLVAILIAQTPKPGTVEGVVTNQLTGQPVKKALVHLNGAGDSSLSAATDASGKFHFAQVPPGNYIADVEDSGYSGNNLAVKVAEEQEVKDLAIRIMPLGVISGRVLDENGDPMMYVRVTASRYVYSENGKQLQISGSTVTNDLGRFEMINVPAAKYFLKATAPPKVRLPGRVVSATPEEAYPPTYFPNGTEVAQAVSAEVKPGLELGNMEFHMKPETAHHVRGHVAGRKVTIRLTRVGAEHGQEMARDGSFDIPGVLDGAYILTATKEDGEAMSFARQNVNVSGEDVDGITLTLAPAAQIRGTVAVEEGSADPARGGISFQALGSVGMGSQGFPIEDGKFLVQGMMPNRYLVHVQLVGAGRYVKSIQFNGQDLPDGQIDLMSAAGGTMQVVFGADPGQIHGSVQTRSGAPEPNIMVTASPVGEHLRPDLFRSAMTDVNGNFQLPDLAPGEYSLLAWEDFRDTPIAFPEFQRFFHDKAVSVRLAANGNEAVQVVAIPAAEIEEGKSKLP